MDRKTELVEEQCRRFYGPQTVARPDPVSVAREVQEPPPATQNFTIRRRAVSLLPEFQAMAASRQPKPSLLRRWLNWRQGVGKGEENGS